MNNTHIGVVFASTGGNKVIRALRSLRRMEPDLRLHVCFDTQSKTWQEGGSEIYHELSLMPNVDIVRYSDNSNHWINGTLNIAMSWMRELGHTHVCLLHDDVVFSPLPEHRYSLLDWFERVAANHTLRNAAALTLSCLEAFVPHEGCVRGQPGNWHQSAAEWDAMNLEDDSLWRTLLPQGLPAGYFGGDESVGTVDLDGWFVHCYCVERVRSCIRMGPSGQIIPVAHWEKVGGFDEEHGLVYDTDYPIRAAIAGLPPVLAIPNIPYLHLHNQSIGYHDPATGPWSDFLGSFVRHYGWDPAEFWKEQGRLI